MKFNLSPRRIAQPLSGFKSRRSTPQPASAEATPAASKGFLVRIQTLRPRRSTVLSGIKTTAMVAGQLGSAAPVPLIQPIADGVTQIVELCETVRRHKKECIELKDLVVRYANALERATEGVSEDKMDAHLAYALAELDDELVKICRTMKELARKSFIRRIISTGKTAEVLARHRRGLQDAIALFQTPQLIRMQINIQGELGKLRAGSVLISAPDLLQGLQKAFAALRRLTRALKLKSSVNHVTTFHLARFLKAKLRGARSVEGKEARATERLGTRLAVSSNFKAGYVTVSIQMAPPSFLLRAVGKISRVFVVRGRGGVPRS